MAERYGSGGGVGGGGRPTLTRSGTDSGGNSVDGEVLARISNRTLFVMKAWKPCYYIFEEPLKLNLYRSREDYIYNPVGTMIKKQAELNANCRCTEIKCKEYKNYGMLDHFTLEEVFDYGPSIIAKFASLDRDALVRLRDQIGEGINPLKAQKRADVQAAKAKQDLRDGLAPVTDRKSFDAHRRRMFNTGRREEGGGSTAAAPRRPSAGGGGGSLAAQASFASQRRRSGSGGSSDGGGGAPSSTAKDKYAAWGTI